MMYHHSVTPAAAAALALLAVPAISSAGDAPHDETIDQVVVVAHKDERSIRDVAANVTVLSRGELNAELAASIGDAFRYVPGIDYEGAGTRFGTEGINIRGIGGNRVAILVDGVVAVRTPDPSDIVRRGEFGGEFLATFRDKNNGAHGQAIVALNDTSFGLLAGHSWRSLGPGFSPV